MGSWRVLADIESGTRENEVITPWSQIPNLIQLVQGTEQALPLYVPVHGSGPGEIVFLAVLPTAMIRYMVGVGTIRSAPKRARRSSRFRTKSQAYIASCTLPSRVTLQG